MSTVEERLKTRAACSTGGRLFCVQCGGSLDCSFDALQVGSGRTVPMHMIECIPPWDAWMLETKIQEYLEERGL